MTTMTTQIPTDALHTFALGLNRQRDAWLADATTELLGQLLAGEDMFTGDTWLITPAAMMTELRRRALNEYAGGTWCVSCLQTNVTPRHQVPAGTKLCRGSAGLEHGIRTRVVTPCAQTCTTEKCYYEPEGRPDCPLC